MRFLTALVLLAQLCVVSGRAVFAHFMWEHATKWSVDRWKAEIQIAQDSHIEAFALNIGYNKDAPSNQMQSAFTAAESKGFKLFLSLDYAGHGLWPKEIALAWIRETSRSSAIFKYQGKPLVSTFEGWQSAGDYHDIKSQTGIFFCPDWSSLGAKPAAELEGGVADCLFSWAAWPTGSREIDNTIDASYWRYLNGKPYMMPVSPWFFTNLPGYNKNWLWKGDSLWYDRWQQILSLPDNVVPEFIQIISWNDFGESHHIGPLTEDGYKPFEIGKAPYNYVKDQPHDHWRAFLPFVIDLYKNRKATIQDEGITIWYRETMARACGHGGTTANTASQLQQEFEPWAVVEDKIFISALCGTQDCKLQYRIGNTAWVRDARADWARKPEGGIGIYHHKIPITSDMIGQSLSFALIRSDGTVVQALYATGTIKGSCTNGITNWNPVVEGKLATSSVHGTGSLEGSQCVEGKGVFNFANICRATCSYDYCPEGACTCTKRGKAPEKPKWDGTKMGYSKNGDPSFDGLCSMMCPLGVCPTEACSYTKGPTVLPTVSPFLDPACTGGSGNGEMREICEYGCKLGFCPIRSCTCTKTGGLVEPPKQLGGVIGRDSVLEGARSSSGLCAFSCSREGGVCPESLCDISFNPVQGEKVDFRSINCGHPIVTSHSSIDEKAQWQGVGAPSAMKALEAGFHYNISLGREPIDFANNASDYFHGPRSIFCENLIASAGCSGLNLQCHDVTFPAGYFILNSFSRLHDFNMDMLQGIRDAQLNNNVTAIQSVFGLKAKASLSTAIILDIALISWGLIMGPSWPRLVSGTSGSQVKDTTNDIFKWGITFAKDMIPKLEPLGQQNAMMEQMKTVAGIFVDLMISYNTELFSGSLPGMQQLNGRIENGAMFSEGWRKSSLDFSRTVTRSLDVFLMQYAWKTSPQKLFPVIIREDVACGASSNIQSEGYVTKWAYENSRFCGPDGKSYWFVAPRDWTDTCSRLDNRYICEAWGTPRAGFDAIRDKLFMDIGLDDLFLGSIATWEKNGRKNGFKGWDMDSSSESLAYLNAAADGGIRAPGFWKIPICTAYEAWANWSKAVEDQSEIKDWTNFPCS